MPLTGTVDMDNARVDLFVDWSAEAGTATFATLSRHVGSLSSAGQYVRGLFGTSLLGEQAYVSDHEAPLDLPVWYQAVADGGSPVLTAGPFTIPGNGYVWLKDPGRAWADLRLDLCASPTTSEAGAGCGPEPLVSDTFTRTAASAWGVADSGQTWTNAGGAAADYSVSGGLGRHLLSTVTASRRSSVPAPAADLDLYAEVGTTLTSAGAVTAASLMARAIDVDNMYAARVNFRTDGALDLLLWRRQSAVETILALVSPGMGYSPGQMFGLRFRVFGSQLRAKVWPLSGAEPPDWQATTYDTAFPLASTIGMRSVRDAASTSAATVLYDNYRAAPVAVAEPHPSDLAWAGFQDKNRAADAGLFPVLEKERPADVYARRKDMTTGMVFLSRSLPSIEWVYDLFTAGGPLMIQVPAVYGMNRRTGFIDRYYQPADLSEGYLSQDQRKPYRIWSAEITSVDIPVGLPQGTDTANWCALAENYATYADLTETGFTWGQVAQGQASSPPLSGLYGGGGYGEGPYGG